MSNKNNENLILQKMTFITSMGDYFTLFANVLLLQQVFGSTTITAYTLPIKSLAIALAGFTIPKLLKGIQSKNIFIGTQFLSAASIFLFLIFIHFSEKASPLPYYVMIFANTLFWQYFVAARESLSKFLTQGNDSHRTKTAEILSGLLMAQTIGPLLALLTITTLGPTIALTLDGLSFLFCGIVGLKIKSHVKYENHTSIFNPLKYLPKKADLRRIFLLRTLGYWVPTGIFNFLIFDFAIKTFKGALGSTNSILGSAVFYSLCGFGAWVGNLIVKNNVKGIGLKSNGTLASIAITGVSLTFLGFLLPPFPLWIMSLYFIQAIGNGVIALTTQTIRRSLTNNSEFAEIVSLEIVFGRICDWAAASVAAVLLANGLVDSSVLILFASIWFLGSAQLHKKFA